MVSLMGSCADWPPFPHSMTHFEMRKLEVSSEEYRAKKNIFAVRTPNKNLSRIIRQIRLHNNQD